VAVSPADYIVDMFPGCRSALGPVPSSNECLFKVGRDSRLCPEGGWEIPRAWRRSSHRALCYFRLMRSRLESLGRQTQRNPSRLLDRGRHGAPRRAGLNRQIPCGRRSLRSIIRAIRASADSDETPGSLRLREGHDGLARAAVRFWSEFALYVHGFELSYGAADVRRAIQAVLPFEPVTLEGHPSG
jgi:hypothetical protein